MEGKRVLAAGHICLDITPAIPAAASEDRAGFLKPGAIAQVGKADIHSGGSVANTGMALHFFGVDTVLAAKIGRDAFGSMIKSIIKGRKGRAKLEDALIEDPSEDTSYSVVIAPPGIDRMFLHNPGANNSFCASDISDALLKGISHFHFGYPPLMRGMYEKGGAELAALFRHVKSKNISTSLDMAMVDPDSEAGRADWLNILAAVLPFVDYFVPSLDEICFMLKREIPHLDNPNPDISPLRDMGRKLLAMGAKTILIKCGAAGMYYAEAGNEGFVKSYPSRKYVSATGAGDTSIAAFLAERLKGEPLKRCVQVACAAGAACIEAYDALSGLKPLEELEKEVIVLDGGPHPAYTLN